MSRPIDGDLTVIATRDIGAFEYEPTITNQAPIANAEPDQSVNTLALVTLDGSASSDPDNDLPLTYQWTQTDGEVIILSNTLIVNSTFTTPGDPCSLSFSLVVTDKLGISSTADFVVITVVIYPLILFPPLIIK